MSKQTPNKKSLQASRKGRVKIIEDFDMGVMFDEPPKPVIEEMKKKEAEGKISDDSTGDRS